MISCISLLLFLLISGGIAFYFWMCVPFAKIRDLDAKYLTCEKGMSREQVIKRMGDFDYRTDGIVAGAMWDDDRLRSEEDEKVASSISYRVSTFFLPVTFEFTFDNEGKLVGRHRYD